MILSDLLNFSFIFILLILLVVKFRLSHNVFLLLAGHLMLVFCLNYVLFSPHYLGDQFQYLEAVTFIRSGFFNFLHIQISTVSMAGIFMALTPIPIANSIYALSMGNVLVYIISYIVLLRKGILKGFNKLFYLLYPSFALYSAVALRDMWITVFMLWSLYFVSKKKNALSVLVMLPLILIKPQNILIYVLSLVLYVVFIVKGAHKSKLVMVAVFSVFLIGFMSFFSVEKINFFRGAMYAENMRTENAADLTMDAYVPINNTVDLVRMGFTNAVYFMFKPFIWESRKPLQLVQSIENIVLAFIFIRLFLIKRKYKVKSAFLSFLVLYILIAFGIYGLVVFNFGTAVRYKFPYVVVFVVFYYYELLRRQPLIINEKIFSLGKGKK
ncbi:MAG: hypothetical protein A2Y40_05005 [Candidatus Margulisbacteria bacterium GWF2_35_9]|nr:MAG: hypothetical protein A2Y40_05005 [Candidatus Margulisbacteria bacterium GWF2_35_9]